MSHTVGAADDGHELHSPMAQGQTGLSAASANGGQSHQLSLLIAQEQEQARS